MKGFGKFLLIMVTVTAVIAGFILLSTRTNEPDSRVPAPEQFADSEHRVREIEWGSDNKKDWEYEDAFGNRKEMAKCKDRHPLSSTTCFETEDTLVRFEYRYRKGMRNERITYDGVEYETECIRNGDFWDWNVRMYCATVPSKASSSE